MRDPVFFDSWIAFREFLGKPVRNPALNLFEQLTVDMLVPFKLRIKEYDEELMQQDCVGIFPVLERWPTLSEDRLARLALWLVKDVKFRIALAIEYSLELDPKIVDQVMGWGKHRESTLNKAKSEFKDNYRLLKQMDRPMPRYLLAALLNEDLNVPSCEEPALIKVDIDYCRRLIKAMPNHQSVCRKDENG
jgi:hypothetical protein